MLGTLRRSFCCPLVLLSTSASQGISYVTKTLPKNVLKPFTMFVFQSFPRRNHASKIQICHAILQSIFPSTQIDPRPHSTKPAEL
jgi:hypothetical protein